VTFSLATDLRFRYELAEQLGRTVNGIYDLETGELLEPGVVHMDAKEYRHWKQLHMRRVEEDRIARGQ
jgi:hypothetical protein